MHVHIIIYDLYITCTYVYTQYIHIICICILMGNMCVTIYVGELIVSNYVERIDHQLIAGCFGWVCVSCILKVLYTADEGLHS